jgi:hypothetical protein
MFLKCTAAASIFLLSLPLLGADKKEMVYEQGVLMNLQSKAKCHTFLTMKPVCTDYVLYWVRVGEMVYKGSCRERMLSPCPFDYAIHDPVEVRFDGNKMFLKRSGEDDVLTRVESVEKLAKTSAQSNPQAP